MPPCSTSGPISPRFPTPTVDMTSTCYDESGLKQFIADLTVTKTPSFPKFDDGDVEIRLSTSAQHTYRVHSLVLGLHSPFFKASLSQRWSGDQPAASSSDPILWRYEVRFEDGQADGICIRKESLLPVQVLPVVDDDEMAAPTLLKYDDGPTTGLARARRNCIDAHMHLLRLIYHKPLALPKASFMDVKGPLESIMTLADMYGCSTLATTHVENYLSNFKHSTDVFTECYKDMAGMLAFSVKVRSAWLFRETMMYAINDTRLPHQISENPEIYILIEAKRDELMSKIASVNQQIMIHVGYPKGEDTMAYILARAYFRDWFTHKLRKQGVGLSTGYAKVYRRIHRRKVPSVKKFQIFIEKTGQPESVSLPAFCGAVLECFTQAAHYVYRLVICSTVRYSVLAQGSVAVIAPFTCTEIHDDELPWEDWA